MKNYEEIADAKLFAFTQLSEDFPIELEDAKELVAYCAKVSNPALEKQADMKNADRLINYLVRNAHWSPLEMVNAVLEINTTRDIGRQIIRHPSFRFQEFSQRYAEALTEDDQAIEFVLSEARLQDHDNRQNSIEITGNSKEDMLTAIWWRNSQQVLASHAETIYKEAIRRGLAKEVARKVLPEGMTTTRMFMSGTIRSWIHYIELRQGNGTQKEHIMIANACAEAIGKVFKL